LTRSDNSKEVKERGKRINEGKKHMGLGKTHRAGETRGTRTHMRGGIGEKKVREGKGRQNNEDNSTGQLFRTVNLTKKLKTRQSS